MTEPIHIVTQTKREYDAERMANYKEGTIFSEILAFTLIFIGAVSFGLANKTLGIVLMAVGIYWLVKLYKKSMARIRHIRHRGKRELRRIYRH